MVEGHVDIGTAHHGGASAGSLIMKHRSILSPSLLGGLSAIALSGTLFNVEAQAPPPPPLPPPMGEEAPEAEAQPDALPAEASAAPTSGGGEDLTDPTNSAEPWDQPVESATSASSPAAETYAPEGSDETTQQWFRNNSLRRHSGLSGSTGLQRVKEAGSGPPGTFRVTLMESFYSGKGFLCRDNAPCRDPITGAVLGEDSARRADTIFTISATPFSFLEAFMGIKSSATSNSNGSPQNLQAVGDSNWGLKLFSPAEPDSIFSFGGEMELGLLTGSGGVGVADTASLAMRALASADFANRTLEEDRLPLRAHLNMGYLIDNSAKIVEELEQLGRGSPIERTERYGLGISRVDSFEIGLGTEYVHPYFRPFLEWTADIPVNRQKYTCNPQGADSRGDECLGGTDADGKKVAGLGTSPNRFTLGARVFPWQPTGLALIGALDIGSGGVKRFLEETTPETPYSLWFGVAYAVDVVPPEPIQVNAENLASMQPETRRYVIGRILEATQGAPIADAIIRYDGVPMTGLVADSSGQFISQDLPPGEYTFKIFAEQFREGICTASIPESAPPADALPPPADVPPDPTGEAEGEGSEAASAAASAPATPYMDQDGNILVPLDCQLEELPRVANLVGLLVDSVSGGPVPNASVTITDKLNRSLKLGVDAVGSFQFRNVPFGDAHITASAPGYLTMVTPISIDKREGLNPHLLMNARPEALALKIGPKQITLERPVQFVGDQANVTINSMSILEELAEALKDNEKLNSVEIQVHTDDSGAASYSRQLSQERADVIKDILIRLGVAKERLTAKGYGPDQPLAPNVSDANRAANNRVQIMLLKSVAEF